MSLLSKEEYVQHLAKSLSLPPGVIENIVARREEGDERDGGWKVVRMITVADLQPYGLEDRLTAPGWRSILRSIVEE